MTIEEKLIADYLKKNQPTKVESSDTCKDIYTRGYIKLVEGKCCSYCGTKLNKDNTFIKVVNKLRIFKDTVSCIRCSEINETDKNIVSKVGYDGYLLILDLKKDLALYKEVRNKGKEEIIEKIEKIKNKYNWVRSKERLAERDSKIAEVTFVLDSYDVTTTVNVDIKRDDIKSFIKNSEFVLNKYLIDYTKLTLLKDVSGDEDYDDQSY